MTCATKLCLCVQRSLTAHDLPLGCCCCCCCRFAGTGKTTVARLFGKMLGELGLRKKDAFKETSGQALLQDGSGKFAQTLKDATPGVLFIDEVYQLEPSKNPEGRAITDMIMQAAENDRAALTIIVAGYTADVREKWLSSNPGLPSRFPFEVTFSDFGVAELRRVFVDLVRARRWTVEDVAAATAAAAAAAAEAAQAGEEPDGRRRAGAVIDVATIAARRLARGAGKRGFANARSVRVLFEASLRRASTRQVAATAAGGGGGGGGDDAAARTRLTRADVLGAPIAPTSPLLAELNAMTGLADVKASVRALIHAAKINYEAEMAGDEVVEMSLHRTFMGNPGTGKTSIAKLYGKILSELGYLDSGEVIVVGASKLVGDVVGSAQTATNKLLDSAAGKVLVIDEAYVLARTPYGKEALDVLVERVQGGVEGFAVILCGYEPDMREMFRTGNPGLARRFRIDDAFMFADYNDAELEKIMQARARAEGVYVPPEVARVAVREVLAKQRSKPNFGNVGAVNNLLQSGKAAALRRGAAKPDTPLARHEGAIVLLPGDLYTLQPAGAARAALEKLCNAGHILEHVDRLEKRAAAALRRGDGPGSLLRNYVFAGPPGTGKTTVARAFAEVFHGLNLLARPDCVECKAKELIAQFVGQSAPLVTAKMREALGGVLFIDECYGLNPASNVFARDALEQLLGNMTHPMYEGKMVIVLAGYNDAVDDLLNSNGGLKRRVTERIDFPAWDPADCLPLLRAKAAEARVALPEALEPRLLQGLTELSGRPGWGSAGDAVTLFRKLMDARDVSSAPDGSFTEAHADEALGDMLRQRPHAHGGGGGAGGGPGRSPGVPGGRIAPPPVPEPPRAAAAAEAAPRQAPPRVEKATASKTEEITAARVAAAAAPPAAEALWASLDAAFAALKYSPDRVLEVLRSRDVPPELVEFVAASTGQTSSGGALRAALVAQCPVLLPRFERMIAGLREEVRQRQRAAADLAAAEAAAAEAARVAAAEVARRLKAAADAAERAAIEAAAREAERAAAAAAEAAAEALRQAEEQRRRRAMGAFICGVCGRVGCPVRPIWTTWVEGGFDPTAGRGRYPGY